MEQKILSALYAYNAYANRTLLATAAQLPNDKLNGDLSPSHNTIKRLLLHMVIVEAYFFSLCQERPLELPLNESSTLADLEQYWDQLGRDQQQFLAATTQPDLDRELVTPIRDTTFRLQKWQLLIQAYVHSAQHRGELSTVLTQLGYPLPLKDIIIWFIEQSGQEWPWPL